MNAKSLDVCAQPRIVDGDEWRHARLQLLAREKALTRLQDDI